MKLKKWQIFFITTGMKGWIGAAALVILVSGCATTIDPVTKSSVYNSYTIEEDITLGKAFLKNNIEEMRSQDIPVNEDSKMVANLEAIVDRIATVSDLPDLPYTVTLFQSDIVNAAAAPGGAIMVYEGLYDAEKGLVRNNRELAAVIAHEIAHVTCRHGTEGMTRAKSAKVLGSVLSTALGVVVGVASGDVGLGMDASDLAEGLYGIGAQMWFPSYSRTQEYEADRVSLTYLAKARINPQSALEIWKRAAEMSEEEETSIFASHPGDEDRFKKIQEYLPEAMEIYERAGGDRKSHYTVEPLGAGR